MQPRPPFLYDPVIGRFISADSIVPNPFDPQLLNRYSYCRNNPLIYIDPSGHHYGTDSPGGKADFGGETVSGNQIDSISGARADDGWGEFYNPSTTIRVNTETFIMGKAIVQRFTYVVKRKENILASTVETKIAGYTNPKSTPFEELNRKYKEQAVELTPENVRDVGKACACATVGMLSLGIVAEGYGLIEAYGLLGSLPEAGVIGYGLAEAAAPGPPGTGPGQVMSLGKDVLGWCFGE